MIYLFTGTITLDSFIENEVNIFSHFDEEMTLIPLQMPDKENLFEMPSNVHLNTQLAEQKSKLNFLCLLKSLINKKFIELLFCKERPKNLKYLRQAIYRIYRANMIKDFITKNLNIKDNDILYSYWLDELALGLTFYLKNNSNLKFISRAHGTDIYQDLVGAYIPFSRRIMSKTDKIYSVSQKGADFLKAKYPDFSEKIAVSHLGVPSRKICKKNADISKIAIVSCSNVVPVKRVDLIFKSIVSYCNVHSNKEITWTHIGGGDDFDQLATLVKRKPTNLQVVLTDIIPPSKVIDYLSNNYYDVFVNLSTSEGIPVSIMEALSFSIPIVATDAGGNCEIVNDETGFLLPINFKSEDFCNAVNHCIAKSPELSKSIPVFYSREFNDECNYTRFYKEILST